jgi:hypothetical protein
MNRHRLTCGASVAQALVEGLPLEDVDDDRPC